MEYRSLGRTGVQVSPLCLGTWNFGARTAEADALRIIDKAIDHGINFIDTADAYADGESEQIVGKALAGSRRSRIFLSTKVHYPISDDPNDRGNSRRHIIRAVELSLRRLQTDWIDLYQVHRPAFDVPQDETLRALDDLVRQGKVRYIGSSTFPAWMVMEALALSERYGFVRFVTEQPPYNILDRRIENELVPLAERYNLGLVTWGPLAIGILAGRYPNAEQVPGDSLAAHYGWLAEGRLTRRGIQAAKEVATIAADRGITPAQLAVLWVISQPAVAASIVGPRTVGQLEDVLPVLEMGLSNQDAEAIDRIVPPGSAVGDWFNTSGWMKMKLAD